VEEFTVLFNQHPFSTIICSFVLGKIKKIKINSKQQKTETCGRDSPFLVTPEDKKTFQGVEICWELNKAFFKENLPD
jgi:hypothetical protein